MIALIISLVFGLLTLTLVIVAAATPGWLKSGVGIFIDCISISGELTGCTVVLGNELFSLITAILCIVSATFAVAGLIMMIVFVTRFVRRQGMTAATLFLISALCAIAAGSVYLGGTIDQTTAQGGANEFYYSFYLCWCAGFTGIIAAILGYVASTKGNEI